MTVTAQCVREAAATIAGAVMATPCLASRTLSQITGAEVWLKFENLQFTASFKERGALNKLAALAAAERAAGVLAVSAGNHAQAVAYHARRLGMKAVIVMPRFTPHVKIERTRDHGAEVILEGETFDEAMAAGRALAKGRGLTVVHPYDDERVICGQGTVALEMLAAQPGLEVLVVPVGGGGLIAGMAVAAKDLVPAIELYGVETSGFPAMRCALHGAPATFATGTIAEGIAVKAPGALTLPIVRTLVRDVLLVDDGDIGRARGAAAASGALPRPEGRRRALRRQHRSAPPLRHHRARDGTVRAPRAPDGRAARPAGRAGEGDGLPRRSEREHRGGPPSAGLHASPGALGRGGVRAADARPGARGRDRRRARPGGVQGGRRRGLSLGGTMMSGERPAIRTDVLLILLLAYAAASLFHYAHNAEFLNDYPNMPAWLSRARVYSAWLGVTAVGLVGYSLIRWRYRFTGLVVLGCYGVLGLDGLGHYAVAPVSAHTLAMNLSIGLEAATAVVLLAAVASFMLRLLRQDHEWKPHA